MKYPAQADHIDTVIINGTECEPYITSDDRLMRERAREIIEGCLLVQHIIKPKQVLIGIEDNKPEAIEAMQQALSDSNAKDMFVRVFPTKYPSGGEKQLIYILTGKELPKGNIPAEIGIVCQNVGTIHAIYEAVYFGKPLTRRVTTVTGGSAGELGNYDIFIGTPIIDLLEHCQWQQKKAQRVIIGGPMMGFTVKELSAPLIKNANCLLVPSKKELPVTNPANPCIRCGMCEQVCPAGLLPQQLHWYAKSKDFEKAEIANLADCIECGACSYVCPSQIPLVQYFRYAKGEIAQEKLNQQEAELAKQRFEARQARLKKAEEEKEAKRKARAEKAALAKSAKTSGKATPDAALIAAAKAKVAASKKGASALDTDQLKEKAQLAVDKVNKAKERLQQAKEQAPDTVAALKTAVEKLEQKAIAAQQAWQQSTANEKPASTSDEEIKSLEDKLLKAQKKAEKAKQRIEDAKKEQPDLVAIQQQAYEKFLVKVTQAEQALAAAKSGQPNTDSDNQQQELDVLIKKIDKAKGRLQKAKVDKPHLVAGIEKTIQGFEDKLAALQAPKSAPTQTSKEPVDVSELQAQFDKLVIKCEKAQQRLTHAKAEKPHLVAGLEANLAAFTAKRDTAEQQLQQALANSGRDAQAIKHQQLRLALDKAEQKYMSMQKKYEQALADNPELAEKLQKSVQLLNEKVQQATTQLKQFEEQA